MGVQYSKQTTNQLSDRIRILIHGMMKEIEKEFKTHPNDLEEDKSLCSHIFYQSGRCLLHQANSSTDITSIYLKFDAQKQLEKSLELHKN